jgi:hypothetical protein
MLINISIVILAMLWGFLLGYHISNIIREQHIKFLRNVVDSLCKTNRELQKELEKKSEKKE